MADKKISALTAATTPLDGTEVLPIVQSGATKKVANNDLRPRQIQSNATSGVLQIVGPAPAATRVMTTPDANFTAARTDAANSFSGNQNLSDGNLIIGTAGKGIDFSANANAPGMTSEVLNDYEEGTWTPTITSASGTITLVDVTGSKYTKIGRYIYVVARIGMTTNASVGTSDLTIGGLPYAVVTAGMGNLVNSNYSASDFGTGGAHGIVRATGSNILHANRTVDMSNRGSTFYWTYNAVYEAS